MTQEQEQTPPGAGLDIAGIEARLKAITPGGWMYWGVDGEERFRLDLIEGDRFIARKVWDEVDAQFIANAPTDIAALLQRVKGLEAEKETAYFNGKLTGIRAAIKIFRDLNMMDSELLLLSLLIEQDRELRDKATE